MTQEVDSLNSLRQNNAIYLLHQLSWCKGEDEELSMSFTDWCYSDYPDTSFTRNYTFFFASEGRDGLPNFIKDKIEVNEINFIRFQTISFADMGNYLRNQKLLVELDIAEAYGEPKKRRVCPKLGKSTARKIIILSTPYSDQPLYKMHRFNRFSNLVYLTLRPWRNQDYRSLKFVKKFKYLKYLSSCQPLPETLTFCPKGINGLEIYELVSSDLEQKDWDKNLKRLTNLKMLSIASNRLPLDDWKKVFDVLEDMPNFEKVEIRGNYQFSYEEFKEMYPNNKYITEEFTYYGHD